MGYDAYFVALEAIKNAGTPDSAKVMEAMWGTTFEGVSGPIAFDAANGDAVRTTAYFKHANTADGTWEALPPVTVE